LLSYHNTTCSSNQEDLEMKQLKLKVCYNMKRSIVIYYYWRLCTYETGYAN